MYTVLIHGPPIAQPGVSIYKGFLAFLIVSLHRLGFADPSALACRVHLLFVFGGRTTLPMKLDCYDVVQCQTSPLEHLQP